MTDTTVFAEYREDSGYEIQGARTFSGNLLNAAMNGTLLYMTDPWDVIRMECSHLQRDLLSAGAEIEGIEWRARPDLGN